MRNLLLSSTNMAAMTSLASQEQNSQKGSSPLGASLSTVRHNGTAIFHVSQVLEDCFLCILSEAVATVPSQDEVVFLLQLQVHHFNVLLFYVFRPGHALPQSFLQLGIGHVVLHWQVGGKQHHSWQIQVPCLPWWNHLAQMKCFPYDS